MEGKAADGIGRIIH